MQPAPAKANSKANQDAIVGLILFVVVFLAFLPAVFNDFTTYDDPEYVTQNPHVQSGLTLESFEWAFRAHGANWHPVTWLSHILDGQIYGLKPWGHHLTNILLHALGCVLVFRLLRKITGRVNPSFIVALLFGVHPLRVESVAWIAERKDVLSVCFCMLTLLAYARYATESKIQNSKSKVWYGVALLCFALGLLSKSMLVTLPCVLLLLDFWPLARFRTENLLWLALEKLPFFLLALGMSVIAYFAQYHGTAMVSSLSLPARIANALVSYCRYLRKIFWPTGLCAIYPLPLHWPTGLVIGAAALLAGLTIVAVLRFKSEPYLAFGWFWFLGTLVPVIGIIQVGNQAMADRYSYLPSLGIFIALVWWVADKTQNWPRQSLVVSATTAVLVAGCLAMTTRQIHYWRNSEALFQRAVDVTQNNTLACVGLGDSLAARSDWTAAIARYHQAIQISPGYYEAHENLGKAFLNSGHLDEALGELRRACEIRPHDSESAINLGIALAQKGSVAEAVQQFQNAIAVDSTSVVAHEDLGKILFQQKDFAAAAEQFKIAVELRPDDARLHYDLAEALQASRRLDDAIAEFRAAVKLAPDNSEIHNDLGTALANKGELDDAIREFQAAVKLNPRHPMAATNLARALELKNQPKRD